MPLYNFFLLFTDLNQISLEFRVGLALANFTLINKKKLNKNPLFQRAAGEGSAEQQGAPEGGAGVPQEVPQHQQGQDQ